jgi:hypothetical protein
MCIHIYIYIYMHIYTHTYTYTYLYLYVGSAFAVGSRIVELLDPAQDSMVFKLLSLRACYRGCKASQRIQIETKNTPTSQVYD